MTFQSLILVSGLALASGSEPFTFVVVGDTQTDGYDSSVNWDVVTQIIDDMNTHDPVYGLFVGDLVAGGYTVGGTISQWEDFIDATAAFTGTRLPIPGNHDVYGGKGTFGAFADTFDWLPTDDSPSGEEGVSYYVDYENVRFIAITSNQESGTSSMVSSQGLEWLAEKLAEAEKLGIEHTVVYTHHPMSFSDANYLGGTAGDFWQTLVAYDVTGVFSGHWHRYQPSQPGAGADTWETIIGTGGGWTGFDPIRPYQQMWGFGVGEVDGDSVVMSFYADEDGDGSYDDLMDSYTMAWPMEDGESTQPHGLIARYSFEDGAADDDAPSPLGRGLHATMEGGATVDGGGVTGDALWVTGTSDYGEAGAIDDYVLSLNGDLTLSLWVQFDEMGSGDWSNVLLCYGTNDYYEEDEETNYSYYLSMEPASDGTYLRFYWEYESGSNVSVWSTVPYEIDLKTWHHILVTRNADTMEATFYLDGAQVGDAVSIDQLPTSGGRGMLYFGSDTPAYVGYGYELYGGLDEVCIYDEVLGESSITALSSLDDCANHGGTGGGDDTGASDGDDTGASGNDDTGTPTKDDTGGGSGTDDGSDDGSDDGDGSDDTGQTNTGGDDGSEVFPGDDGKGGSCGCATPPRSGGIIWLLSLAGLVTTRRRSARFT